MGASRTGRDVGRVGRVGVRAAQAENEKAGRVGRAEKAGRTGESRCLYFGKGCLFFAYCSLNLRSSCIVPISFLKGKWGEKKKSTNGQIC